MSDPILITSPLSGRLTEGDMTVDIPIYRFENTQWALEVADGEGVHSQAFSGHLSVRFFAIFARWSCA
jgi:hypothetical protein